MMAKTLHPAPMSESHLADEFAARLAGTWRYCQVLRRWFYWDGQEWKDDRLCEIDALAILLTREAAHWPAATALSPAQLRQIGSKHMADAIRALAECDRRISATPEDLGYVTPAPSLRGVRWNRAKLVRQAPPYAARIDI